MQLKHFTDLGLRILMYLATRANTTPVSISELALRLNWNKNLVVKVTHYMVQEGWLTSIRGRSGGLLLAQAPENYRMGTLVRKMEGEDKILDCEHPPCPFGHNCSLLHALENAYEAFFISLDQYTLADIVRLQQRAALSPIYFVGHKIP